MAHKKIKLNKNGDVEIQHFDEGGTALSGPSSTTGSTAGSTQGIGAINSSIPYATSIQSAAPSQFQGALNPLGALQNATQTNFQATGANLQAGTNAAQLNQAYNSAQSGLGQQQDLVNALKSQGGIGNQASVFNQQQQLANALQNQAAGNGPSPAQAALAENTGKNVATQSAMMAGQRGAGANAGLMARQAAQQGAATQQQAVGQGATLKAQEQLGAENALQNQQQQMGNTATSEVSELGQGITGYNTAAQNEQNMLQTANSNFNNANVGMQSNLNNVNAQIAQGNQAASNGLMGGIMNGAGSMMSSMMSKGGVVGEDGQDPGPNKKLAKVAKKDRMPLPHHIKGMANIYHPKHFDEGGDVEPDLGHENYSPEASVGSPNIGSMSSTDEGSEFKGSSGGGGGGGGGGGIMSLAALMSRGGKIPGKPKVEHNDIKNDVVPAKLTPGEVVLPLSVMNSNDPGEAAKKFVEALAKKHGKMSKHHSDFHEALKTAISSRGSK